MKHHSPHFTVSRRILGLALVFQLAFASPLNAASVALATAPLANATTTTVLPNLMFLMDNSGSMGQDYTPDWIMEYNMRNAPWTYNGEWNSPANNQKNCRDSADDDGSINTSLTSMDMCVVGDVPFMASAINSQYYNPGIRYLPGVNADGSSKPSQTDPTTVLLDGYDKHKQTQLGVTGTSINLTTSYPDRVWCTTQTPTAAQLIDTSVCRKNSDYLYPNATYKYGRDDNGTTANKNVLGVYGAPYYYSVVVTEYCSETELRNCVTSSTATGIYTFPARARWCSDTNLTTCQSIKTGTYVYPRYPGASTTATAATGGAFRVGNSTPRTITNVKFGSSSIEILGAAVTGTSRADLAAKVVAQINLYASNPEFAAVVCSTDYVCLTSTTAAGASGNGSFSVTGSAGSSNFTASSGGVTGTSAPAYTFARTDIVAPVSPDVGSYPKATSRTDCAGATCTYAEEITNFGNWYAYYRTRMQSMKSAVSLAFKPIGSNYRVGFINICKNDYLPVATFDNATVPLNQKINWYDKLFNTTASGCGTPLRSALATAGRIFAGKELSTAGSTTGTSIDPVQYSCQQNFALLTTDGYWNGDGGTDLNSTAMGNLDGGTTPRPMYEGPTASTGSLADVAKYYYDTDLRNSGLSNCTGSLGLDVCENNVFVSDTDNNLKQHMTTFTLGLGVDGTLSYVNDYKSATSGDYYNLKNGLGSPTVNWSVPAADTEKAVDDLWHAAVNGQGTYFSAKDPAQLASGLNAALAAIGSKVGASSAAATSTLNPVAGNNYAYVASYSTVKWLGNLEARSINVNTGLVSESASWCVENVVGSTNTCTSPSAVVANSSGSSIIYNCVTPSATLATCPAPGVLDGTDCKVELPVACTGTMPGKVGVASDTRTIYKSNGAGALQSFVYANLNASDFTATGLSQWSVLTETQKTAAAGENLVNFLRGQTGFEERTSNTAANRLYRFREATLGDALESQPSFISKPVFNYADSGYAAYKTAQASRAGSVYMGANDGMLHAFSADTGVERWAYVPTVVIPNMWKLADKNYSTGHTNYVNGSPIISDICTAHCSCDDACVTGGGAAPVWKTILVGGLNAGGRSYYALDITNPSTPSLLWEISSADSDFSNLGFSYGQPVITKKSDGTWVVLVTSGYNNTSPGDGKGYLYVLNAATGARLSVIGTTVGDTTTPSGLAKIAGWNDFGGINNSVGYVYGGDILGNLWRFDINTGVALKFATLNDSLGNAQPITTTPTLGLIKGQRVVMVGTGKYLEVSDLTNTAPQTIYTIKDNNTGTGATLTNVRTSLVAQTINRDGLTRTGSNNAVDFVSGLGWYVDLAEITAPSTVASFIGERVNIDMRLVQGTLIAATIVPSNTVCSPGGSGWLNFFNYETGGYVESTSPLVSALYQSPIVGVNVLFINGKPVVEVVTASKPTPEIDPNVKIKSSGATFTGKRVMWRELLP